MASGFAIGYYYNATTGGHEDLYGIMGGPPDYNTILEGIDGKNVVGRNYNSSMGSSVFNFLYDGATYTAIDDHPLGEGRTYVQDISGDDIVGYYIDSSGHTHGFVATIPEPASARSRPSA